MDAVRLQDGSGRGTAGGKRRPRGSRGLWCGRQKGVANSMCQQLVNGAYGAFRNHVKAQSGKFVSAEHAGILISPSNAL